MKNLRLANLLWRGGICILFLAFVLFQRHTQAAQSAASPFLQRVWQSDQGLPHNLVNAVLQTRDGYLWVGTRRGVARFDGVRFTPIETPEIKIQNVTSLCEDAEGSLWIATEGGVFRLKNGETTHFGSAEGLAGDNVRAIHAAKDGSVWIGTAAGLTRFNHGKFQSFTSKEGLAHNVVRSICEDGDGNLWITTDGGLNCYKDGVFSITDNARQLEKVARVACLDQAKNLWVGTQAGLYRRKNDGWDYFGDQQSGLSDNFINTIYSDRSGRLWIGTYGGLNRLENGKVYTEFTAEGAAYDQVNGIVEDREGNIWIGSKDGLTRLKAKPFAVVTKREGLAYNNVMSVLQDKSGIFWCGTWGGGLFRLKDEGTAGFVITNTFPNKRILSLCEGRDGSLWFGTDHGDGLYRLKDEVVTRYDEKDGLERIGIPVVFEDREGNLWFGTRTALVLFRDGKFTRYTTKDGLAGDAIRVIFEDHEGSLWVGTDSGLSRRRNGKFTNFTEKDGLSHDMVVALYEDKEDTLWIGTAAGGLNRLKNGKFTAYTPRHGLFSYEVLEILEDDYGDLWMSCLKGIFRVRKQDLDKLDRGEIQSVPCACYGKEDGMASIVCSNVAKPPAWKAKDGRLWFATTKGLAIADPTFKINHTPPAVSIEEVIADTSVVRNPISKLLQKNNPVQASDLGHPVLDKLVIQPGCRDFEIHYTALSFQEPEKNRFKYKLEGVDPDWVDAGARRVAYYNNIRPGSYIFRVKGCNNNRVWNETETSLAFVLLPHFWQTWWFMTVSVLAAIISVGGTARLITKQRMERQLERLEQQHAVEKERSRIAQDMHDELGARLTEIRVLSDLTEKNKDQPSEVQVQSRRISDAAGELIRNLHSIVWAVNPANDSLEKLVDYLCGFAQPFLKGAGIRCRLERPDILPDVKLSAEVRHNIVMAVKEALNNTIKHAGASEVRMTLAVSGPRLHVSIEDNGRGFDPKKSATVGNGLQNMEKRMQNINGCCQFLTEPGKGTTIRFEIPLKNVAPD